MSILDKLGISRWSQGRLLDTSITRRWSAIDRTRANAQEKREVFSNFRDHDEGKSRYKIATCDTPNTAQLIATAPEMLEAFIDVTLVLDESIDLSKNKNGLIALTRHVNIIEKATGKSWEDIKELL